MTTQEKRKQLIIAKIERRRQEKVRRKFKRRISYIVTAAIIFITSIGAIYSAGAKEITVTEINEFDGISQKTTIKTHSDSVKEVLEQTGHSVSELDKLNVSMDAAVKNNDDIVIKRGKQVTIKSDTGEYIVTVTKADVTDALIEAGHIPGEFDEVTTNGETLAVSDTIELISISATEESTEHKINYKTEYIEDPNMPAGQTRVVSEGEQGLKSVTNKISYKNGNEISREVISEDIIVPAKNRIVAKGTGSTLSSVSVKKTNDSGNTINGMKYTHKITMTATAYSTSPSENGGYSVSAMGNPLGYGIVAVDPTIIPLGSKLYIESTDGTWTYGVARAEDTGGAIKGNRIDLCYNGSVSEINKFGRRSCVVYILQ